MKHQHQATAEHVEGRTGDGGLEEIGGDPGLHTFGFTSLHRFLDLAEMNMLRSKQHALNGMLMQRCDEIGNGLLCDVDLTHDLDLRTLFCSHLGMECLNIGLCTSDEDTLTAFAGSHLPPQNFTLP